MPSSRPPHHEMHYDGCFHLYQQLAQEGCACVSLRVSGLIGKGRLPGYRGAQRCGICGTSARVHVCILVVFCKSLSHPKPELLSDDLIDLHESVWGAVKATGSDRETGKHCTITLSKIRSGTPQSHLNNKKVFFFFKGMALLILILHTIGPSLPSLPL